jgi:hypothetical protein
MCLAGVETVAVAPDGKLGLVDRFGKVRWCCHCCCPASSARRAPCTSPAKEQQQESSWRLACTLQQRSDLQAVGCQWMHARSITR